MFVPSVVTVARRRRKSYCSSSWGATEVESRLEKWSVAPWYYEQLAISYRKCGNAEAEVSILERYSRQIHDPASPLLVRLAKARARATRTD